jgi:hypothetical protein
MDRVDEDKQDCTGVAAQWCPIHGECICPKGEEGDSFMALTSKAPVPFLHPPKSYVVHDPWCPLHGEFSSHAEPVEDEFEDGAGI